MSGWTSEDAPGGYLNPLGRLPLGGGLRADLLQHVHVVQSALHLFDRNLLLRRHRRIVRHHRRFHQECNHERGTGSGHRNRRAQHPRPVDPEQPPPPRSRLRHRYSLVQAGIKIRGNWSGLPLVERIPDSLLFGRHVAAILAHGHVPIQRDLGSRLQGSSGVRHHQLHAGTVLSWTLHDNLPLNTTRPYAPVAYVKFRKPETAATSPPTPNRSKRARPANSPSLRTCASTRQPAVSPAAFQSPAEPPRVSPGTTTPAPRSCPDRRSAGWRLPPFPDPSYAASFRSDRRGSN